LLWSVGNWAGAQETNAAPADKPTNAVAAVTETNAAAAVKPVEPIAPPKDAPTSAAAQVKEVAAPAALSTNASTSAPATNASPAAVATTTNAPAALSYEYFKLIAERNIFDPSRTPRSRGSRTTEVRRTPRVESFALVGTMSYAKGDIAFFDGTSSQYHKAAKVGDAIGAYKVKEVTSSLVKLAGEKQEVELKVGQQLRREDEGEWQVAARSGSFASSSGPPPTNGNGGEASSNARSDSPPSASSESPSPAGASDLLKRLREQREKELNK
jgi:hypothetical protein